MKFAFKNKINKNIKLNSEKNYSYIFYIPKKIKKGVIYLLIKDLLKNNAKQEFFNYYVCSSILDIYKYAFLKKNKILIFIPHQSYFRRLSFLFQNKQLIIFFTHFDPRHNLSISALNNVRKVLFLGMNEYNYYKCFSSKLTDNSDRFRLGYDNNLFFYDEFTKDNKRREIDFIVSCNYNEEFHYAKRKNYPLIIETLNILSKRNYSIVINGNGWMNCRNLDEKIKITNLNHKETPNLFRKSKVFLMLSRIEGGHTSLVEALACNTKALCCSTGFSFDFSDLDKQIQFISTDQNSFEIAEKAEYLLSLNNIDSQTNLKLSKRLEKFSFNYLNNQLKELVKNV